MQSLFNKVNKPLFSSCEVKLMLKKLRVAPLNCWMFSTDECLSQLPVISLLFHHFLSCFFLFFFCFCPLLIETNPRSSVIEAKSFFIQTVLKSFGHWREQIASRYHLQSPASVCTYDGRQGVWLECFLGFFLFCYSCWFESLFLHILCDFDVCRHAAQKPRFHFSFSINGKRLAVSGTIPF